MNSTPVGGWPASLCGPHFIPRRARMLHRLTAVVMLALGSLSPTRAVELRFLNVDGPESALKFTNKDETVTITADDGSFSPVFQFEGPGPLVLFKENVSAGKPVRVTAATLPVPAELTHALVILSAADKSLSTYSGVWIDDAPASRPAGTILLLNQSTRPLSFKLDAEEFTLAPLAVRQMPFSRDTNRIMVHAEAKIADKWERVFSNPLAVRAGVRVLLLLRDGRPQPGSNPNIVDMLSFYDRPPALPEPPPAASP